MICKEGFLCLTGLSGNGTTEGKMWNQQQFSGYSSTAHRSNHPSISITIYFQHQLESEIFRCTLYFKLRQWIRKNYLFRNVNQRRSSKQSEGVQSNDDHLGRGIRRYQLLKQLPGAGGQASVMMHVLQNRDQLQFQVHRCGQTYKNGERRQSVSPLYWLLAVLRHAVCLHRYHCSGQIAQRPALHSSNSSTS